MSLAVEELALEEFEVVVVGAGPGGLAAAVTLASQGVRTLVVDRRQSPSTLPRATVASTATMELLRRWGLEESAWERSLDVEWRAWSCETLSSAEGEAVDVGLPTREQAALVSPTAPACLAQDELEPLLEDHLGSLPSARIEREIELVGLEQADDGGHLLELADRNGRRRTVRSRYVIGADGVRSRVRAELGIPTEACEGLAEQVAVIFRAPIWDLLGERRYGIYFVTGGRGGALIPAGSPDRWVFGSKRPPGAAEEIGPELLKRWIRDATGDPSLPIELERTMPVDFGVALAQRFRHGDAFLIGDAAHRVTPRGGTGLNSAIRDGFDVAWKLAWVLRGWADPALLDSYERERRPVAEFNTQRSTRSDGSILGTVFGLGVDIGGRIPHVWVPRGDALVSTLDLLGAGLTLYVGPDWNGSAPSLGAGAPPVSVERLDAIAARAFGLTAAGSLLARPDGYPVALWNDEESDPARLARAIATASGSDTSLLQLR